MKSIQSPEEVEKIETPIQEQIKQILQQEAGMLVTKIEIEKYVPKQQKNTSFKNKKQYKHNGTAKVRK